MVIHLANETVAVLIRDEFRGDHESISSLTTEVAIPGMKS